MPKCFPKLCSPPNQVPPTMWCLPTEQPVQTLKTTHRVLGLWCPVSKLLVLMVKIRNHRVTKVLWWRYRPQPIGHFLIKPSNSISSPICTNTLHQRSKDIPLLSMLDDLKQIGVTFTSHNRHHSKASSSSRCLCCQVLRSMEVQISFETTSPSKPCNSNRHQLPQQEHTDKLLSTPCSHSKL